MPRAWHIAWGGAALLGAATALAVGPLAPVLVETLLDDRQVWRLGRLNIDGVSGAHLGDLRINRLELRDEAGVYAIARDVKLDWTPWRLLLAKADISTVSASGLELLRQPALTAPTLSGVTVDLSIASFRIEQSSLAQAVFGQTTTGRLAGLVALSDGALSRLTLDAAFDSGDQLNIAFDSAALADTRLTLNSPKQGLFASLLGAQDALSAYATAKGDLATGDAQLRVMIGQTPWIEAQGKWRDGRISADASADLTAAEITSDWAKRLGPSARFSGALNQDQLRVTVTAQNVAATLEARIANAALNGPLAIEITAPSLAKLAPEWRVPAGAARLKGVLVQRDGGWDLQADAALDQIRFAEAEINAAGPVRARWADDALAADVDFQISATGGRFARLLNAARLTAQAQSSPDPAIAPRINAALKSESLEATAAGTARDIAGAWRIATLQTIDPAWRGGASGQYTYRSDVLQLNGIGAGVRAPGALAETIGPRPTISARLRFDAQGAAVETARLQAANASLAARGRIGARYDLALQAVGRGPTRFAGFNWDGDWRAQGALSGPLASPQMQLQAEAGRLTTPLGPIDGARLAFTADSTGGEITLRGDTPAGPLLIAAPFSSSSDGLETTLLRAEMFGLRFSGAASATALGPQLSGEFQGDASGLGVGLSGALSGRLSASADRLDLSAKMGRGRWYGAALTSADLRLNGPLSALDLNIAAQGRAGGAPAQLNLTGTARIADDVAGLSANLSAQVLGAAITSPAPITLEIGKSGLRAEANLAWGQGGVALSYRGDSAGFSADLRAQNADLAPLLAAYGEPGGGKIDGQARLSGDRAGLTGQAQFTAADLSLRRRAPDPLDLSVTASLSPNRGALDLNAHSKSGLSANLAIDAPLTTATSGLRIALAPGETGAARWRAQGPAAPLWAAFGPLDQRLTGEVDLQGEAQFNSRSLRASGQANLRNGTFEDRTVGIALRDMTLAASFDPAGARLTAFSASDARGGKVTGAGALQSATDASLSFDLQGLQLINRSDIQLRASGPVAVRWQAGRARVSGQLALDEAIVSPPRPARQSAALEVREINRPEALTEVSPALAPRAAALPVSLDLALTAPGRVFVRGRGLQSEWSLDMRARGEAGALNLTGEARLIRGDFRLAGRPFAVSQGRVRFVGPVEEAELAIEANQTSANLSARLNVAGTLAKPEITFSSSPSLPPDEILPQIAFGRSGADLSPLEAAQIAASLAELSGQAAFDLAGAARDLVQLDRLDLRQSEAGLVLAGGKYLTRDVYLELSRSSLGQTEAQIDWQVQPDLFLISRFGQQGDARVSLRWRQELDE
jgi:translocation and assembly module TamB